MALQPFVGPWPLFQFLNLVHSRWDSLKRGSARRKASTYSQNKQTQNKRTQTSMPWGGFEPTIPAFERANTVLRPSGHCDWPPILIGALHNWNRSKQFILSWRRGGLSVSYKPDFYALFTCTSVSKGYLHRPLFYRCRHAAPTRAVVILLISKRRQYGIISFGWLVASDDWLIRFTPQVAPGHIFSEYFGFPCQFSIHRLLHTHLSSGAGTMCQRVADVPSGLSLTH
jgi:hypothetical protein